jgi:hypothetical protein
MLVSFPGRFLDADWFGIGDQLPAVGPDCGGHESREAIYFSIATT